MSDDVFELRRYELRPGRRDELIELFDREFVESQDAVGAHVVAQYRDRDDPDQFVWIRSFTDMRTRLAALTAFYGGPVWKEHAAAANATMVAVDDVLLLRPVIAPQVEPGSRDRPKHSSVTALLYAFDSTVTATGAASVGELLADAGRPLVALFATLDEPNDFPGLTVRDVHRVVAVLQHDATDVFDMAWPGTPEVLRLAPTARSHTFRVP